MDKEKLDKAMDLYSKINRLDECLNSNDFKTMQLKIIRQDGTDHLYLHEGSRECFYSDADDTEFVNQLKGMVLDFLKTKLSKMQKEFDEL